jgi:hypothetical protein
MLTRHIEDSDPPYKGELRIRNVDLDEVVEATGLSVNQIVETAQALMPSNSNGYLLGDGPHAAHPCAMRDGKASVFVAMGGNFVGATPDTDVTEAALRGCSLTVHVSTKLNRSHLVTGRTGLILLSLGRTDKDVRAGKSKWLPSRTRCRSYTCPAAV